MSDRRLLERGPNWSEWLVFDDDSGDTYHVERLWDVEGLLDYTKAMQNVKDGYSPSRELVELAHFHQDAPAYFQQRFGADPFKRENEDLLKRILNDSEFRHFRVNTGVV